VDADYRVVRIVRDPRGVAYSCAKVVRRPEKSGPDDYMAVWGSRKAARNWVTTNLLVAGLRRLGVREETIRYEDLVRDPRGELERVLSRLDLPQPADGIGFLSGAEARLSSAHTLDGNPMRFSSGAITLRPDEEWRSAMAPRDRRLVEAITWPLRRRFGYLSGD
jgi:hypothetical protein